MASPLGPRSTALVERLGGVHRRGVMGSLDALSWFFAVVATSSLAFVESYKAFEITDEGRAEAEKAAERPAPWEQTDGQEDPSHDLRHRFGQLAQAFGAVASTGNDELIAKAASEIDDLKRRLYQLLAES